MSLHFLPWRGERYDEGLDGVRVLVLGESHYVRRPEDDRPDLTQGVVRSLALAEGPGGRYYPFFTKAARLVEGGGTLSHEACADLWHRVAFCNFVQEPVGDAARKRPSREQWSRARAGFGAILDHVAPDCVVVLGRELWRNLPAPSATLTVASGGELRNYGDDRRTIWAVHAYHPSAPGFTYEPWASHVAAARELVARGLVSR